MSDVLAAGTLFVREHLRVPLTVVLLLAIPAFFVLIFAGVLADFSAALGGTIDERASAAISAGWAAAFMAGTLAFFQVSSSRGADRRLALLGMGAGRVALARIAAALVLAVVVSAVAYATLWLRSGVAHPVHAAAAVFAFAAIYTAVGALVGALVSGPLEGSLLVLLVFAVDVFSGPAMTDSGGVGAVTPTRHAGDLLIEAGRGQSSAADAWAAVALTAAGGLAVAYVAFWLAARPRGA